MSRLFAPGCFNVDRKPRDVWWQLVAWIPNVSTDPRGTVVPMCAFSASRKVVKKCLAPECTALCWWPSTERADGAWQRNASNLTVLYQKRPALSHVEQVMETGQARIAVLVKQMAAAIRYIHSMGIVHRDIKLENWVFASPAQERLKLIDFGLATRVVGHSEGRNIANFKYCDDPMADAFLGPRWENVSPVCKEMCSLASTIYLSPESWTEYKDYFMALECLETLAPKGALSISKLVAAFEEYL
eukprot:Skav228919  [mRNA]  locus=scaffold2504:128400:134294:+ [translate_table: standard]